MSNKKRGESEIRLDRTRIIRFNLNALAEFEDAMGMSALKAMQKVQNEDGSTTVSFKLVRALLWAGLTHEDERLTLKKAGELFEAADGTNLMEKITNVFPAIAIALLDGFGDENAKETIETAKKKAQEAQQKQTGTNSNILATEA